MGKKTLVIGASPKPVRFSHQCVKELTQHQHPVIALGNREGEIDGVPIQKGKPQMEDVHTITLYLGPKNQQEYYDYILGLKPERIIFNPGTENDELKLMAEQQGIQTVMSCTLMMLSYGTF
ncbi:MAG: CoA-binding protein [Bacteroidales bacterium]|nr:CoA-binding protein [Bacteroidales bacterium]